MIKLTTPNRSLLLWYIAIIVPVVVSTAAGLDEVGQGVLGKKIEHYKELGYTVFPAGPYPDTPLVSGDYVVVSYPFHEILTVPASRDIVMQSGIRLFFEPSVRFEVAGSLQGRFVVLNSVPKEQLYLGTLKSDTNWNGIHVAESGRLDLSRAVLSGADTLIAAEAPRESMRLKCLELRNPGSCPIVIQGECIPVNDPSCFTPPPPQETEALVAEPKISPTAPADTAAEAKSATEAPVLPPTTAKRPVLRTTSKWATIGFGALAVGAGIAAYTYHREAGDHRSEENRVTSTHKAAQARENYNDAIRNRDLTRNLALGAAVLSAGFGVIFIVNF